MALRATRDNQAMTAEERLELKRLRQRNYVKQAYDRQKQMMTTLRQQVAMLEAQFDGLLSPSTTAQATDIREENPPASKELLHKYNTLTQLRCSLVIEHEALCESHAKLVSLNQTIQKLLDKETSASPFYFRSLLVTEYELVVAKARAVVTKGMAEPEQPCLDPELGWKVSRVVEREHEHNVLTFSLKKSFTTIPPHELLQRSWAILSSPSSYTQLYSPSVRAELHLLEHVDDDTLLYYTTLESAVESTRVIRSVYLLRRESFANGSMILLCSVDPNRLDFDGEVGMNHILEQGSPPRHSNESSRWAKICAWVVFEEQKNSDGSLVTWGGLSRDAWATEVQMIAMRWQILVVGYDALLQHQSGDSDAQTYTTD